ncbi:MAG: hypothetical protein OHK0012_01640 [Synechococcales cyanobacterium]
MSEPQAVTLNTGLPSVRRLQKYIQEKQMVRMQLSVGDPLHGVIRWQDTDYFYLSTDTGEEYLVARTAVIWIQPLASDA